EVSPAVLILVPALAGIGLAWQQAVNGRVGAVGGPFPATGINFAVGLLGLLAVEAVVVAGAGLPSEFPPTHGFTSVASSAWSSSRSPFWSFVGSACYSSASPRSRANSSPR